MTAVGSRTRPRDAGALAVAAATVISAAGVILATRGSYFTTDDHVFFAQDRDQPFGLHFLTEPIYDHFSPWHRLQDHIVASLTDQGWWLAVGISLLWYAATVAAFTLLVRELVGRHPAGIAVCVLLTASPIFVRATQWWALAAQQLPQLCFSLVAVWAGLRLSTDRRRRWLVLALGAYVLALCAFIKALLVLPLLALLLYLRPDRADGLHHVPRLAWHRDRALWGGLAALTVAYLGVISDDRYYRFVGQDSTRDLVLHLEYVVAALAEGAVPLALGATVPSHLGAGNVLVLGLTDGALLAVVAVTVARKRTLLATWTAAAGVALGAALMSSPRLDRGVDFVALDPRYQAEGALTLLLALALAGAAVAPGLGLGDLTRGGGAVAVGALALGAAFAVDSALRLERTWVGPKHRAYFETFDATLASVRSAGSRPALLDGPTPGTIVPPNITGANLLSRVLPLHDPSVRPGRLDGPPAAVEEDGRVRPLVLRLELTGSVSALAGRDRLVPAPTTSDELCLGGAAGRALTLTVDAAARERLHVLAVRMRPSSAPVSGTVSADSGLPAGQTIRGFPLPQVTTTPLRVPAGSDSLGLVAGIGRLRALTVAVEPGSLLCVRHLAVGSYPLVTERPD